MSLLQHLPLLPILLPLVTGVLLLWVDERRRTLKQRLSILSALGMMGLAVTLLVVTAGAPDERVSTVYRLGDWPAPFAIVLVADRLSAVMLGVTGVLGLCGLLYSLARWDRAGTHFHTLFQFQLMGLNGAFLTGDLFNLFVFFELLLAASYGLVLHGSELRRVKAGLHYIAINLLASSLFLVGVSLLYSVTGTLNMADLAARIPEVAAGDRPLLHAGAAVLAVAFLVKAGMYPLSFWLPGTYASAAPPVAAMFSVMTKVGVYVLLRLSLLSGLESGFLLWGGVATVAFGSIAALATQNLSRLASYSVLVSSGTLLAVVGAGKAEATGGALFYLVGSTLGISAFFLLIELVERGRDVGADMLAVTLEAFGEEGMEQDEAESGVAIPATLALLGGGFLACALLLSGLPPLPGFLGKFAILDGLLGASDGGGPVAQSAWVILGMLVGSGAATLIAMIRAGIRTFWSPLEREVPRVKLLEVLPVALLLLLCVGLTLQAGPVMRYLDGAAKALHAPEVYIQSVLGEAK